MGKEEPILRFCIEKGFLLDQETCNLFEEIEDVEIAKLILDKIKQYSNQRVITKSFLSKNQEQIRRILSDIPSNEKIINKFRIKLGLSVEISNEIQIKSSDAEKERQIPKEKANFEDVRIVSMHPALNKKISVDDFVKHFRARFLEMKKYLQEHRELTNLVSINKISGNRQGISIIGMVSAKRTTKNKNILLEVEDMTGKINAIVNHNKKEIYKKAEEVALDSIIGLKCSGSKEIVFVNDIIFPDSALFERKKSPEEKYALFSGDFHIGSTRFLRKNFEKFVDYLNYKIPNSNKREIEKIKYLILGGDLIAGLGIYPGQEKELEIKDVEEQYHLAAELLGKIRKDIRIIIASGNHDAVRIMEPQPPLDEKYAWPVYELKNVVFLGNPATINIASSRRGRFAGYNILIYHGYSFHYYAKNVPSLRKSTNSPEKIMAYLLKHRHLAPSHASTLYSPSEDDPHIIREIPDIFFSGHTHRSAVSYYNNILMISSSSWESLTPFQERMGNEPDFCKVPMLNLKTRAVKILDFE